MDHLMLTMFINLVKMCFFLLFSAQQAVGGVSAVFSSEVSVCLFCCLSDFVSCCHSAGNQTLAHSVYFGQSFPQSLTYKHVLYAPVFILFPCFPGASHVTGNKNTNNTPAESKCTRHRALNYVFCGLNNNSGTLLLTV